VYLELLKNSVHETEIQKLCNSYYEQPNTYHYIKTKLPVAIASNCKFTVLMSDTGIE